MHRFGEARGNAPGARAVRPFDEDSVTVLQMVMQKADGLRSTVCRFVEDGAGKRGCHPRHLGPDCDQKARAQCRDLRTQCGMRVGASVAKLKHVRQHHDLRRRGGEACEGRRHRGRTGIIAVIDQGDLGAANIPAGDSTASWQIPEIRQIFSSVADIQPESADSGKHRHRIHRPMRATHAKGKGKASSGNLGGHGHAIGGAVRVAKPDIRCGIGSEGDEVAGAGLVGTGRQNVEEGVITVQDGGAAGGKAVKISALALAIASRLSKKPAWLSAMRVMMAISGRARLLNTVISPGAFMPIS